jgi:hypothetical protein
MPNWVFNTLDIFGSKEDLDKLQATVGKPNHIKWLDLVKDDTGFSKVAMEGMEENEFSFRNIIPSPDTDEYFLDQDSPNNWYRWNVDNWDTKWNAVEVHCTRFNDDNIVYQFATAWSEPLPVIEKLHEMFPQVKIVWSFDEEFDSFAGHIVYDPID